MKQLENLTSNLKIPLSRIAELIDQSTKKTEKLIESLLITHLEVGEYQKKEKVFIRRVDLTEDIDSLLEQYEGWVKGGLGKKK